MTQIRITLIFLLTLALSGVAFAIGPADIRLQMAKGEYKAAYAQAEQLTTAEGHILAAESLLSEIMLGQAEKNKKQAKRARKLAEAALELEPSSQNARLQYAVADGFVAREAGDVSAWIKKIPQKTEAIIQAYRTDFPDDPRGDVLLGAWHLAIARKAGNKNGQKMFGANIAEGRLLFQTARMVQPDDIIIGVNYAFSLLALKDEDYSDIEEAREVLRAVIAAEPTNYLERELQSYASEALTKIEERDLIYDYVCLFLDGKVPEFPPAD